MTKAILIQCPEKFSEVVPIFIDSAATAGAFEKIYLWSNCDESFHNESSDIDVVHVRAGSDNQFSSNMKSLLSIVEEDVFMVCCEDHIMTDKNDPEKIAEAYDFVANNDDAGFLRLTEAKRIKTCADRGSYRQIDKSYPYYVSLQPAIWKKGYFKRCLKAGDDAWDFERRGSKLAKKSKRVNSFIVKERACWFSNFFHGGNAYRSKYIDYAVRNGITPKHRYPVYHRKKEVPFEQYWAEAVRKHAYTA